MLFVDVRKGCKGGVSSSASSAVSEILEGNPELGDSCFGGSLNGCGCVGVGVVGVAYMTLRP